MKPSATDTPDVTDASAREKTGKTLNQWFAHLDELGGIAKGRRELVSQLYSGAAFDQLKQLLEGA